MNITRISMDEKRNFRKSNLYWNTLIIHDEEWNNYNRNITRRAYRAMRENGINKYKAKSTLFDLLFSTHYSECKFVSLDEMKRNESKEVK